MINLWGQTPLFPSTFGHEGGFEINFFGKIALYPPVVWPVLTVPTRDLKVVT